MKGGIISFIFYNNTMVWFSSRKKVTAQSLKNAGFFYTLKNQSFTKKHVPQSNSLYFGIYFITPICELENEWSLEKIRSIIYFIQAFFHKGLKGGPFDALS